MPRDLRLYDGKVVRLAPLTPGSPATLLLIVRAKKSFCSTFSVSTGDLWESRSWESIFGDDAPDRRRRNGRLSA